MGKVNIGLRGWRFDEDEVFDDDGRVRPLGTMDEDTKARVLRLTERLSDPCDACWLRYGQDDPQQCSPAEVIYGEPRGEVILCRDHETDFVYWFREVADEELIGTRDLQDAFHGWFADGGRAPEGYAGVEHVDEDPEGVPETPDPHEELPGIEEEIERIDDEDLDALDIDLDDLNV
ncbi:hypothetical protein IL252_01980 [Halomicrobium sp. IBSBa]|uniref:hypothetical protein n=1 Tax=Halomicrobium sp. IBSBa TaxID=2778916 RepID=UPI001ABF4B86|nr:hypothetical protein [Halomicrobium sp. IBSBa]MBO4246582.1 hypothetical protein [Halomicrobium sp. IBSBa]